MCSGVGGGVYGAGGAWWGVWSGWRVVECLGQVEGGGLYGMGRGCSCVMCA